MQSGVVAAAGYVPEAMAAADPSNGAAGAGANAGAGAGPGLQHLPPAPSTQQAVQDLQLQLLVSLVDRLERLEAPGRGGGGGGGPPGGGGGPPGGGGGGPATGGNAVPLGSQPARGQGAWTKMKGPVRLDVDKTKKAADFDAWAASWRVFETVSGLALESELTRVQMLTCHLEKSTIAVLQSLGIDFDALGSTTSLSLLTLLRKHVVKQPNVAVSRKLFRSRVQEQGECFDDFLRNLRVLARDCEFDDFESELETALKEQVLMGVRSFRAQERILELPFKKTTLSQLVDVCRVAEQASRDAQFGRVKVQNSQSQIRQVSGEVPTVGAAGAAQKSGSGSGSHSWPRGPLPNAARGPTCWNCGGPHMAKNCDQPKATCKKCNRDHLTRFCESIQQIISKLAGEEDEPALSGEGGSADANLGDALEDAAYDDLYFGEQDDDQVDTAGIRGVHAYAVRVEESGPQMEPQESPSQGADAAPEPVPEPMDLSDPELATMDDPQDWDPDWLPAWLTPGAQQVWTTVASTAKEVVSGKKKKKKGAKRPGKQPGDKRDRPP